MSGRIRTIKPEILEDERTASLSHEAFRAFVGLITLSDDWGNVAAHPARLHAAIFWACAAESGMPAVMNELARAGLIRLYEVHKQRYLHLSGWERHQRVEHPSRPRVPMHPEGPDEDEVVARMTRGRRDTVATVSGQPHKRPTRGHGEGQQEATEKANKRPSGYARARVAEVARNTEHRDDSRKCHDTVATVSPLIMDHGPSIMDQRPPPARLPARGHARTPARTPARAPARAPAREEPQEPPEPPEPPPKAEAEAVGALARGQAIVALLAPAVIPMAHGATLCNLADAWDTITDSQRTIVTDYLRWNDDERKAKRCAYPSRAVDVAMLVRNFASILAAAMTWHDRGRTQDPRGSSRTHARIVAAGAVATSFSAITDGDNDPMEKALP